MRTIKFRAWDEKYKYTVDFIRHKICTFMPFENK